MFFFARVGHMLFSPVREWYVIEKEPGSATMLFFRYVIPMAMIPAVASFIGYGLVGASGIHFRVSGLFWGSAMAIDNFVTSVVVYWLGTWIVNVLGNVFGVSAGHGVVAGAGKNIGRSAQLVAYSYTPAWIAGIFYIFPSLQELVVLGLYSVYLFYAGIPVLKPTPEDQRVTFTIVSAILLITIRFLIGLLIVNLIYFISGNPYLPYAPSLF
jgi:Yip1 domain